MAIAPLQQRYTLVQGRRGEAAQCLQASLQDTDGYQDTSQISRGRVTVGEPVNSSTQPRRTETIGGKYSSSDALLVGAAQSRRWPRRSSPTSTRCERQTRLLKRRNRSYSLSAPPLRSPSPPSPPTRICCCSPSRPFAFPREGRVEPLIRDGRRLQRRSEGSRSDLRTGQSRRRQHCRCSAQGTRQHESTDGEQQRGGERGSCHASSALLADAHRDGRRCVCDSTPSESFTRRTAIVGRTERYGSIGAERTRRARPADALHCTESARNSIRQ